MRKRREARYLEDQTWISILFFMKNFLKDQRSFAERFAFAYAICSPLSICFNVS